jgi:hypothetical protein
MSEHVLKAAIEKYITLRDEKKVIKERHSEELRPINEALALLENAVQKVLLKQGADSFKTKVGTAYLSTTVKATVKDWPAFRDFVQENDLLDMLEHRASKDAVEEFIEANGDAPPGVAVTKEVNTRFRK